MFSRRDFILSLLGLSCVAPSAVALTVKDTEYIPISQFAQICGMRYKTTVAKKAQTVYSKYSRINFIVNARSINLNGTTVWLGHPIVEYKGMLYLAKRDYFKTIRPIMYPQNNGVPPRLFNIFIDAGHGGKDKGAINKRFGIYEKSLNLDIALRLGKILRASGYNVSYSRTGDTFLDLPDRPAMANKRRADLFLSIHCNAASPSISGIETFALTPRAMPSTTSAKASKGDYVKYDGHANDEWNQMLAYYIQRALHTATRSSDRGVKKARFAVLKDTRMPASLIECGFISNDAECRKLMSAEYRQSIARTIANAVMNYHNTLRRLSQKK